jgi:hypothetical protein
MRSFKVSFTKHLGGYKKLYCPAVLKNIIHEMGKI